MSLNIFQFIYTVIQNEKGTLVSTQFDEYTFFFPFFLMQKTRKKCALFQLLVNPITLMGIGKPAFKEIQGYCHCP